MPLNESQEIVTWPETHYVFVEKRGPIPQNAPVAWQEFHKLRARLEAASVKSYLSLYGMEPPIYRAGVSVCAKPAQLPDGLRYERFGGGKYARFVLTGGYSQLPQATGRVFELVRQREIPLRSGFHIEHYVNDPATTPEPELITEILFPVA